MSEKLSWIVDSCDIIHKVIQSKTSKRQQSQTFVLLVNAIHSWETNPFCANRITPSSVFCMFANVLEKFRHLWPTPIQPDHINELPYGYRVSKTIMPWCRRCHVVGVFPTSADIPHSTKSFCANRKFIALLANFIGYVAKYLWIYIIITSILRDCEKTILTMLHNLVFCKEMLALLHVSISTMFGIKIFSSLAQCNLQVIIIYIVTTCLQNKHKSFTE